MALAPTQGFPTGLLAAAALVIVAAGVKAASAVVAPLLLAAFIAIIAYVPIAWLQSLKFPKWFAMIVVLLVVGLFFFGVGSVVMGSAMTLFAQQDFYQSRLTEMFGGGLTLLREYGVIDDSSALKELIDPKELWNLMISTSTRLVDAVSSGFLILLVFLFVLGESSSIPKKISAIAKDQNLNIDWLKEFGESIRQYIGIKTSTSLATGVLVTCALWILGVDFPVLWGMLAFMLNFIPNIGSVLAAIPAVTLALIQLGPIYAIATIVVFVIVNIGIGTFVEPRFLGKGLGLSTLVVFLSLILWGYLLGTIGMLLAVPLTVILKLAAEGSDHLRWISTLLGTGESELARETDPV